MVLVVLISNFQLKQDILGLEMKSKKHKKKVSAVLNGSLSRRRGNSLLNFFKRGNLKKELRKP